MSGYMSACRIRSGRQKVRPMHRRITELGVVRRNQDVAPRRFPLRTICPEENHCFVRITSRDHRGDYSTRLRRHGRHAVRKAYTHSLRRNACHNILTVRITTNTEGAYLRYTLDGSTPTGGLSGNGTQIEAASGNVSLTVGPREKTLKAIAYKPGLTDSAITEGTYVYQSPY